MTPFSTKGTPRYDKLRPGLAILSNVAYIEYDRVRYQWQHEENCGRHEMRRLASKALRLMSLAVTLKAGSHMHRSAVAALLTCRLLIVYHELQF